MDRIANVDWERTLREVERRGYCVVPQLLSQRECADLIAAYDNPTFYRSLIVMARHNFGLGEYKYYAYPLPPLVAALRRSVYPHLVPLANRWAAALGQDTRYPAELDGFLAHCHENGQARPTPLILRYEKDGYNCLHQDLYGELSFPFQLAILLSRPGEDFEGGELVLTEQRPRMQSRAEVLRPAQGDGVVFAVNERPVRGTRGYYRVRMRHGVSTVSSGNRYTLGVIFHDAS